MRPSIAIAVSLFAFDAAAATFEDAQRLLDNAAPMQCEVLTMRYQAMAAPAGEAREALEKQMHKRAAEVDAQLAPAGREYEQAVASLSDEDRARLRTYASGLMKECASKASERYGIKAPGRPSTPSL
jgi:hypothetical protein